MTAYKHEDPELLAQTLKRVPLGRVGRPSDVGGAAVYLASPAAAYVTAIVLPVDGGLSGIR
jgi:2-dehydro-3-deoxy-D-gluconate 5-dehydrogenase